MKHSRPMPVLRTVPFSGERKGSAPLTWGQRTTWDDIQHFLPDVKSFFMLRGAIPVPPGLSVEDVLDRTAELVGRHEALRTLFRTESGQPVQEVQAEGELRVTLFETADNPAGNLFELMSEQIARITGASFDHTRELPMRMGVALVQGAPATIVLGLSRLAVDMQSASAVCAELFALLDAAAHGKPEPPRRPARQPLDQAGFERSESGQAVSARSLDHLRRDLEVIPPSMFAAPVPTAGPRYWRGALDSAAVPLALRILAERYRASLSGILFATTTALLNALTGVDRCSVGVVYGNRSGPGLRHAVGSLSETVLTTVPVRPGSFGDHVNAVTLAMMRAYLNARFDTLDSAALVAEVGERRGITFDLNCRFNDMWSWKLTDDGHSAEPAAPEDVRPACARTVFSWQESTDLDKITLFVDVTGTPESIQLQVLADTHRVPKTAIRAFLEGFERVLVELAEHELDLSQLPLSAGIAEFHLGPRANRQDTA
jgi:hypothetical protein